MTNTTKKCEVCGELAFTELSEETMKKVGMCGTCTFGEASANSPNMEEPTPTTPKTN